MTITTPTELSCALSALTNIYVGRERREVAGVMVPGQAGLSDLILDANTAALSLTGARKTRAKELVAQLRAALRHCERLATLVEGDLRAERADDATLSTGRA